MKKIIALLCFFVVFSLQIKPLYAAEEQNSVYNYSLSNKMKFIARWSLPLDNVTIRFKTSFFS